MHSSKPSAVFGTTHFPSTYPGALPPGAGFGRAVAAVSGTIQAHRIVVLFGETEAVAAMHWAAEAEEAWGCEVLLLYAGEGPPADCSGG